MQAVVSQQQVQQPHIPLLQTSNGTSGNVWAKFDQGDKIGEGTFGLVFHARSKEDGGRFAVKQFKSGREGDGISITAIREIMLLRYLSHANIVRLESVHIHRAEPSLWLAFDYAEHDLHDLIRHHITSSKEVREVRDTNRGERPNTLPVLMPSYTVKSIMWQMLEGLSYLHHNWIMHRDLKPANVLVMADGGPGEPAGQAGVVKVADFGLARIFQAPLRPLHDNGVVVTIWYRAPELLLGSKHYTRAVDVWAAGCILAELMMLRPLFYGQERKTPNNAFQSDQMAKIFQILGPVSVPSWPDLGSMPHWSDNTDNVRLRHHEYPPGSVLERSVLQAMKAACPPWSGGAIATASAPSSEVFKLLHRMLDYNPHTRITAEEALQHEWFKQDPLPGPNAFRPPGSKEPAVCYPRRPVSNYAAAAPEPQPASSARKVADAPPPPSSHPQVKAPAAPVAARAQAASKKRKTEVLPSAR
ncbi:MAG: hypothetical protein WDW36_005232 [Sanguina aurantia]